MQPARSASCKGPDGWWDNPSPCRQVLNCMASGGVGALLYEVYRKQGYDDVPACQAFQGSLVCPGDELNTTNISAFVPTIPAIGVTIQQGRLLLGLLEQGETHVAVTVVHPGLEVGLQYLAPPWQRPTCQL